MKATLAAIMLLLQLQPLLGSVACLGVFERQANQACEMPDHGRTSTSSISQPGAAAQSCQLAAICAPASLAIPVVALGLESAAPPLHRLDALAVSLPHDVSLTPPARPPSA